MCVSHIVIAELRIIPIPTQQTLSFHGSLLPRSYAVVRAEKDGGGCFVVFRLYGFRVQGSGVHGFRVKVVFAT